MHCRIGHNPGNGPKELWKGFCCNSCDQFGIQCDQKQCGKTADRHNRGELWGGNRDGKQKRLFVCRAVKGKGENRKVDKFGHFFGKILEKLFLSRKNGKSHFKPCFYWFFRDPTGSGGDPCSKIFAKCALKSRKRKKTHKNTKKTEKVTKKFRLEGSNKKKNNF